MGSVCRASVGESLAKYVGESVGKSVGNLCEHVLAFGSDVWSGEFYLQFAFSLLVAGLGLKAF